VKTTQIDGIAFKHNLSELELAEARTAIQDAQTKANTLLAGLRQSRITKDLPAEIEFRNMLYHSDEARLSAAIAANKKLSPHKRTSLEDCLLAASNSDPEKPSDERVSVYPKVKSSGGFRMIQKFGLHNRIVQELVLRVVSTYYAPRRFQYATSGVPKAVARIKKAIVTGQIYFARLDIANFFPSFDAKKLASVLPCPPGIVEGVVLGQLLNIHMDKRFLKSSCKSSLSSHSIEDFILAARLGIPQGSVCSPIVSSFCMSRLAWPFMLGVTLTNYADDFLLLSSSATLLDKAIGKLIEAVAELPGGQFQLKLKAQGSVADGSEFLGHRFDFASGTLRTSPSSGAYEKLAGKLVKLEKKVSTPTTGELANDKHEKVLAEMFATVNRWASFFRECDNMEGEIIAKNVPIEDWCASLNLNVAKVKHLANAIVAYRPDDFEQYDG
jgi:hypothetical protein